MITPEDAANCKAAFALYQTKDEDPAAVRYFHLPQSKCYNPFLSADGAIREDCK